MKKATTIEQQIARLSFYLHDIEVNLRTKVDIPCLQ